MEKIEDPHDELERIVRKAEDLVDCENKKCSMLGEYWKCYLGNHTRCKIYLDYLIKKTRDDYIPRHHNKA